MNQTPFCLLGSLNPYDWTLRRLVVFSAVEVSISILQRDDETTRQEREGKQLADFLTDMLPPSTLRALKQGLDK